MTKLWLCEVTTTVVMACDEEPLEDDIIDAADEELRESLFADVSVSQLESVEQLPRQWENAIPRGDDVNDATCRHLLDSPRLAG